MAESDQVPGLEVAGRLGALVRGSQPTVKRLGGGHMGGPCCGLGETEFLVFGECGCGWRAALPEGAIWPLCPNCGVQVLPATGSEHRLGYAAQLMPEQEAYGLAKARRNP